MISAIQYNGSYIISGSSDHSIIVWKYNKETSEYTCSETLDQHKGPVSALYVYKDSRSPYFFSASTDKTIILWKKSQGSFSPKQILEGHESGVTCLTFCLNDNRLISGDENGVIKIWRKQENELWTCQQTIQAHTNAITSIRYQLYRGRFFTTGGNEVKFWKRFSRSSEWVQYHNTLKTDSPIIDMKMGHFVPDTGACELFVLTEKKLQLACLTEKGLYPSNKSIDFSN
jgi:WD40 repeat protein